MPPQWLFRYLEGQVSCGKPSSCLISNVRDAARLLESMPGIQYSLHQFQSRRLKALDHPIHLEVEDGRDRTRTINMLLVLTVLSCLDENGFRDLDWMRDYEDQLTSICWALLTAICLRDHDTVATLLKQGPSYKDLVEALRQATEEQDIEVVRLLLDSGADVNGQVCWGAALIVAARDGNVEILNLMLHPQCALQLDTWEQPNSQYEQAVEQVICRLANGPRNSDAYMEIFHKLFHKAHRHFLGHFHYRMATTAISLGVEVVVPIILDGGELDDLAHGGLLEEAAKAGQTQIVRLLLHRYSHMNREHAFQAVKAACFAGKGDVLRVLLESAYTSLDDYGQSNAINVLRRLFEHQWLPELFVRFDNLGEQEKLSILKVFCELGLDLATDNLINTVGSHAVCLGFDAIIEYILSLYAEPTEIRT